MQKRFPEGISVNILLLGVVSFLTDASSEIILPIFPMFITVLGGTGIAVGLIGGLGDSIASLLKVWTGYLSDKLGRRKPFVFYGYLTSSIAKLFFPLSTIWQHLLISRSVERIGKGLRTAPRDAIIADYAPKEIRGKGFGIHRALDTGGAIVGSVAALLLVLLFKLSATSELWIFKKILIVAAIVAFVALIPLYFVREKVRAGIRLDFKLGFRGLSKDFKMFTGIATLFSLGNFSYMFFILMARDTFLKSFALKQATAIAILLYIIYNIFYALFSIPTGILSDKIGRRRTLIIGYSLFGVACLGFAYSKSLVWFIILFTIYGLFYAFADGTQRAFASDLSSEERYGTGLGFFHTATGLAMLPASLIAGALWQYMSKESVFMYGAALAFLAVLLLVVSMKKYK